MKLARGHVQRKLFEDLLISGESLEFHRYMKAQNRYTNYIGSFFNLFQRMEKEGFVIQIVKGRNGGYWTAYAKILRIPTPSELA